MSFCVPFLSLWSWNIFHTLSLPSKLFPMDPQTAWNPSLICLIQKPGNYLEVSLGQVSPINSLCICKSLKLSEHRKCCLSGTSDELFWIILLLLFCQRQSEWHNYTDNFNHTIAIERIFIKMEHLKEKEGDLSLQKHVNESTSLIRLVKILCMII